MPMIGGGKRDERIPQSPPRKRLKKLETDDDIYCFVEEAYDIVIARWEEHQRELLELNLEQHRDEIIGDLQEPKMYPRLLGNRDPPSKILQKLYCLPCSEQDQCDREKAQVTDERKEEPYGEGSEKNMDSLTTSDDLSGDDDFTSSSSPGNKPNGPNNERQKSHGDFTVLTRGEKFKLFIESVGPPLFLEGTHSPRPSSSATIFLKTHYATEDEKALKYVPYFGDDDKDDLVSDLYNTEDREKQIQFGPEYRERDTNAVMDETLLLLQQNLCRYPEVGQTDELHRRIHQVLAGMMDEDKDRIRERYDLVVLKKEPRTPKSSAQAPPKPKKNIETYADAIDSYRPLFCRRCFIYDCNMHSNLTKPSLQLQAELAIQKERDGFWNDIVVEIPSDSKEGEAQLDSKPPAAFPTSQKNDASVGTSGALTQLQKAICERMFLIFQGDVGKMAAAMAAPQRAVADYCKEKGYMLEPFKILSEEHIELFSKQKKRGKTFEQSMNNYNINWLRRVEKAEIHPFFVPCDHEGPCSEENCSCVRHATFCTKHCSWGRRSRNFFRGCACLGKCTTKSCSCVAAMRECDPDLCRTCGACTDPPNQPATTQRCRNDNIGMRRHCQLLVGKSQIEDAGWGAYTRYALKKGDYIAEYVGEVISQEEAERRGRIYDKVNRSYLFNLSSDYVVDASRKGNKTRFANHSSKPNCFTKMVNVNGDIRIGLFAKDDIEPQTELFFDYRYDVGIDNDLIIKPGMTVDWMKNPKMANKISKKNV